MLIEQFLQNSAIKYCDKTALVVGSRRLTYGELDRQCNQLARVLVGEGIGRADRVAIYLENSVETVLAIHAVLKAGAVFLTVDPTMKAEKAAYILKDCRAAGLITSRRKWVAAQSELGEIPHLKTVVLSGPGPSDRGNGNQRFLSLEEVLAQEDSRPLGPNRNIDIDLAALIYTSGSTGRPKGVMLTHLNIVSAITSITTYLENTPDDVILNVLPLSFSYGLTQILTTFQVGATLVLEPSFAYPAVVLQRLVHERVSGFAIVPTIAAILLQMNLEKQDLSSLRYITNAAAPLSPERILQLRKALPHVKIYSMHGLTECIRTTYLPPDQIDVRTSSVGRGMPNVELYLVDEDGHRVGPGVVGELVARGSNVMRGYWEMPEETDRTLKPGPLPGEKVLLSGDLFRADEEGYLYFVSRKDDIIKTVGEKVSPKEVEDVLYTLNSVAEAAVIGVYDEVLGNAIKAVIVLQSGTQLSEQEVLRHCAKHLEAIKVPKFVEFRDELPKTPSGKINKRILKEQSGDAS